MIVNTGNSFHSFMRKDHMRLFRNATSRVKKVCIFSDLLHTENQEIMVNI